VISTDLAIVQVLYSFAHGGSERVGLQLAAKMNELGRRVHVISLFDDDGPVADDLRELDIPCAGFGRYLFRGRGNWLFSKAVRQYLQGLAPLAMHVHHGLTLGRVLPAARSLNARRIVLTEHSIRALQEMPGYRRHVTKWLRQADFVTALSDEMTLYLERHLNVPLEKLETIPNGIDLHRFDMSRESDAGQDGKSSQKFRFVWVGRFDPDKDLTTLISGFHLARMRVPEIELHLIGDGKDRDAIERLTRSLRLTDSVTFHGFKAGVSSMLGVFDAFVMSSRSEGMPMALMEAMAAGLPCIATSVGAIPDMLAGGAGLLTESGDAEMLCEGLLRLADDRHLCLKLAAAARARIQQDYSLDKVTIRYLSLLES
jgi:glycosyltransferase involved in cell wall biosynthesis